MKTWLLEKTKEKLDKNTLKLYTAFGFGTKEHAIALAPPHLL
jgi:hypothetical protein